MELSVSAKLESKAVCCTEPPRGQKGKFVVIGSCAVCPVGSFILLVWLPPVGHASGRASYLGARGERWGRGIREAQKYLTYGFQ